MSPSNSGVVGAFPNPTVDPITGLLIYETINSIHLMLNKNATSVNSKLGDGRNILLTLIVSIAVYKKLSTVVFVTTTNPGRNATSTGTAI